MERISGTAYTYDGNNRLTKALDIARTVFSAGSAGEVAINYGYSGSLLTSRTDIDGTQTSYGYDTFLRNTSITSAAGGSGNYPATTQSFTYNLADLKYTAQESPRSPVTTTYSYETTGRISSATIPHPGSGTLSTTYHYDNERVTRVVLPTSAELTTEVYYDGRIKSKSGTGQVPTDYTYGYGSYTTSNAVLQGTSRLLKNGSF
jgi:YD repeat-containing protein